MGLSHKYNCDYDTILRCYRADGVSVQGVWGTLFQQPLSWWPLPDIRVGKAEMGFCPKAYFLTQGNEIFLLFLEVEQGWQGYAFIGVLWEKQKDRKVVFAGLFEVALPRCYEAHYCLDLRVFVYHSIRGYKFLQGYSWPFLPLSRAMGHIFHNCKVSQEHAHKSKYCHL